MGRDQLGRTLMTDLDDFWRLIEQARIEAPDAVAARAAVRLASRPADEIASYAQLRWDLLASSYRADLWAAAYLINAGARQSHEVSL
jgi:hypothetical protein